MSSTLQELVELKRLFGIVGDGGGESGRELNPEQFVAALSIARSPPPNTRPNTAKATAKATAKVRARVEAACQGVNNTVSGDDRHDDFDGGGGGNSSSPASSSPAEEALLPESALESALPPTTTMAADMEMLFRRIDANSDQSVDWDEFTNYLLLEEQGAHNLEAEEARCEICPQGFAEPRQNSGHHHRELVHTIVKLKSMYMTSSGDGELKLWDVSNLAYRRTIDHRVRVTAICFIPGPAKVVVASVDRCLTFYETTTFYPCGRFTGLVCVPQSLTVCDETSCLSILRSGGRGGSGVGAEGIGGSSGSSNRKTGSQADVLLWGDDGGMIHGLRLHHFHLWHVSNFDIIVSPAAIATSLKEARQRRAGWQPHGHTQSDKADTSKVGRRGDLGGRGGGSVGRKPKKKNNNNSSRSSNNATTSANAAQRRANEPMAVLGPGVQHVFSCRLHNDWVTKIRFFKPLDVVVTSSLDGRLRFFDLERGSVVRTCRNPEGKAVHDFVYCPGATTKFIASSSRLSRDICLWNPHSGTLHATLTGHTNTVQCLVWDATSKHLVSLDKDKAIKSWDLNNYRVAQTVVDISLYRPVNVLSALIHDVGTLLRGGTRPPRLVTASNRLCVWPISSVTYDRGGQSMASAVVGAVYSAPFEQVVSADVSGSVQVWDVRTGKMSFKFNRIHGKDSKVTTLGMDRSGRRLITGGDDGIVRIWNFSNGQCLRQCITRRPPQFGSSEEVQREGTDLTAVAFVVTGGSESKFIITGGWNRRVYVFPDIHDRPKQYFSRCMPALPVPNAGKKTYLQNSQQKKETAPRPASAANVRGGGRMPFRPERPKQRPQSQMGVRRAQVHVQTESQSLHPLTNQSSSSTSSTSSTSSNITGANMRRPVTANASRSRGQRLLLRPGGALRGHEPNALLNDDDNNSNNNNKNNHSEDHIGNRKPMIATRPATSMGFRGKNKSGFARNHVRSMRQFSFFGETASDAVAKSLPIHGARPVSAGPSLRRRGHRMLGRPGSNPRSRARPHSSAAMSSSATSTEPGQAEALASSGNTLAQTEAGIEEDGSSSPSTSSAASLAAAASSAPLERRSSFVMRREKLFERANGSGHSDDITAVCYCKEAGTVATGGHDGFIILWDFENGAQRFKLAAFDETDLVNSDVEGRAPRVKRAVLALEHCEVSGSSATNLLVSAGQSHKIRLWNVRYGTCLATLATFHSENEWIPCLAFEPGDADADNATPDSCLLATGCSDGTLMMWDMSKVFARAALGDNDDDDDDADDGSDDKAGRGGGFDPETLQRIQSMDASNAHYSYSTRQRSRHTRHHSMVRAIMSMARTTMIMKKASEESRALAFGSMECVAGWQAQEASVTSARFFRIARGDRPAERSSASSINRSARDRLLIGNGYRFILTTSSDCTVLLWDTTGHKVGVFGQPGKWDLFNRSTWGGKATTVENVLNSWQAKSKARMLERTAGAHGANAGKNGNPAKKASSSDGDTRPRRLSFRSIASHRIMARRLLKKTRKTLQSKQGHSHLNPKVAFSVARETARLPKWKSRPPRRQARLGEGFGDKVGRQTTDIWMRLKTSGVASVPPSYKEFMHRSHRKRREGDN